MFVTKVLADVNFNYTPLCRDPVVVFSLGQGLLPGVTPRLYLHIH